MLILLFAVSVISFALVELSPIDTVSSYVGENAVSQELRDSIAEKWGLNDPPVTRYFRWLGNILKGDMGTSITYRRPVIQIITERFKMSLILMGLAWILSGVVGFLLGVLSAAYEGSWLDRLIKVYCLLIQSSPVFWLAMVVLLVFAVALNLFPMGLAVPIGKTMETVTFGERLYHLCLPVLTLSLTGIANIVLQTREKLVQAKKSDYALFARARGEKRWKFINRHGIRNILLPAVTMQFASISEIFGGSVLAETVFSYPGLGQATTQAGIKGDIPLLLGIALFSAAFVFFGNLIANILYPIIDPRIREGERIG
jgi:peptide/nickel transport system permease protein